MMSHSHAFSGARTGLAAGIMIDMTLPQEAALAGLTAAMAFLNDLDSRGPCVLAWPGVLAWPRVLD